LPTIRCFR